MPDCICVAVEALQMLSGKALLQKLLLSVVEPHGAGQLYLAMLCTACLNADCHHTLDAMLADI